MARKKSGDRRRLFGAPELLALATAAILMQPEGSFAGVADEPLQAASGFKPNESQVSSLADLIDPEYDQATSRFTWVDSEGSLWVGFVDDTGMFQPPSGKGILVDHDAMKIIDLRVTANGPEWIPTSQGPMIVYTKFLAGYPHIPRNARLAIARVSAPGAPDWIHEFLGPTEPRMSPYASKDADDPAPRITYIDSNKAHYWAEIFRPDQEFPIPVIAPSLLGVRFVPNTRMIVYTAPTPIDSVAQVFRHDLDTGETEQLTFDTTGEKSAGSVWMWRAPEYDNEYVFAVLVYLDLASRLDIYRQVPGPGDGTTAWTKIHSISAPLSKIGSPEPFVFDGRSYISLQMTVGQDEYPTSIWLAGIDPANPLFRMVSDDSLFRWRTDPEVFITNQGPYIYYNRRDPADPNQCGASCSEGIFRAHTGLWPQARKAVDPQTERPMETGAADSGED